MTIIGSTNIRIANTMVVVYSIKQHDMISNDSSVLWHTGHFSSCMIKMLTHFMDQEKNTLHLIRHVDGGHICVRDSFSIPGVYFIKGNLLHQHLIYDIDIPYMSIHIHLQFWEVITYACFNVNDGWVNPPLKLGYEWVITSHIKQWMLLFIHVLMAVKPCLKQDPL